MTKTDRLAFALYLCVAVATGFADHAGRRHPDYPVAQYVPKVLANTYGAPADYRLLAPWMVDRFNRVTGLEPLTGFLVLRVILIYATLIVFHRYLRVWYSAPASAGATLAMAALLPLTFTDGWAHPDSYPELLLFTLGCLAIATRRDGALAAIIAIATLNRETAIFLVLLWANDRLREERSGAALLKGAGYAAVWGAIYVGIRQVRGWQPYDVLMLRHNVAFLKPLPPGFDPYQRIFGLFWVVLLGIPGWLAIRGARMPCTPAFFRRALAVAAVFFLIAATIARLIEARVLIPILPLLGPSALRVFADPEPADRSPQARRPAPDAGYS